MAEGPVAFLSEHTGGDSGPTGRWRGSCAFWGRTTRLPDQPGWDGRLWSRAARTAKH